MQGYLGIEKNSKRKRRDFGICILSPKLGHSYKKKTQLKVNEWHTYRMLWTRSKLFLWREIIVRANPKWPKNRKEKKKTEKPNNSIVKPFVLRKKLKHFFWNLNLGWEIMQLGSRRERFKKYQWKNWMRWTKQDGSS